MRDPYAVNNPYANNFNAFYSYNRNPYISTPAFAYVRNNRVHNPSYHQNRAELIEAGAGVGLAGAGYTLATGKISASIVGAKLAAAGLAIGSGGMIPLIGAIATLGAGAMAGAVGLRTAQILGKQGIKGLEYLGERAFVNAGKLSTAAAQMLGTLAAKGTKASLNFAVKTTNNFLKRSKQSISNNMQQPTKLIVNYSQNTKAEKMFISRIETLKKALKNDKDISKDLKDLFKYKVPSQKALQELNNLTSAYFIKQNASKNKGKIDLKEIKKDFKKFAKEVGLSKKESKYFEANIPKFLEYLKDNLKVTKDNQLAPFPFKIHQAVQQTALQKCKATQKNFTKAQQKSMQKGKQQGKQQMQQQQQLQQSQQVHTNTNIGYGR
jgi:hypothetical protein